MGLDIYFHKTKPSAGVNTASVEELNEDLNKRFSKHWKDTNKRLLGKVLNAKNENERAEAIDALRKFTIKEKGSDYKWYYDGLVPTATDEQITKIVESNNQWDFPREDVYFRKANFVYAFFQPYLENECCIVTKAMVNELIDKCEQILSVAHKDGWVNAKGNLVDKINYNKYKEDEIHDFKITLGGEWIELAQEILPTQAGFFFGSTDYDEWYLWDLKNCVSQFKKLLRTWKEDEVVYNCMSW